MALKILQDIRAADLGLDYTLGLLLKKGAVLEKLLPHVEAKLLRDGKAELVEDKAGPREVKPAKPKSHK